MNTYPSTFLKPLLESYELQPTNTVIRTELATGLAVQREFAPDAPTMYRATWRGISDEIAVIHAWLKHIAGYAWFEMDLSTPDYLSDTLSTHQVRLTARLGPLRRVGVLWELTANLEIKELSTLTEEEIALLSTYTITDIESAAALSVSLDQYLDTYPVEASCS